MNKLRKILFCGLAPDEQMAVEIEQLILEVIGEDEELPTQAEWLSKTKDYGGSEEEYWRVYSITNNYNNLRAEQRQRLAAALQGDGDE